MTNDLKVRTREEQIRALDNLLARHGGAVVYEFRTAERYILEAEQRGYERRVAEERGEPVAWMWEHNAAGGDSWVPTFGLVADGFTADQLAATWRRNIRPLYAAPPDTVPRVELEAAQAEVKRLRGR